VNVDAIASVNRLARRQHGAFSVRQVLRAGVSRQQTRTRLAKGDWERAAVGVLVLSGTPDTWIRRAMVATLVREGRLWVSHSAAAFLHGFDGFDLEPRLELITRRGHHPRLPFGARLRSTDLLGRKCFTTARHVPVSNAATTLCLIAESVRAERVPKRSTTCCAWVGRLDGCVAPQNNSATRTFAERRSCSICSISVLVPGSHRAGSNA
jgi:Transcriptional regulator, AbiEi antitoxin